MRIDIVRHVRGWNFHRDVPQTQIEYGRDAPADGVPESVRAFTLFHEHTTYRDCPVSFRVGIHLPGVVALSFKVINEATVVVGETSWFGNPERVEHGAGKIHGRGHCINTAPPRRHLRPPLLLLLPLSAAL